MPDLTSDIDFLWQSFLKGDDKSFAIIYQHYIEPLFSYGFKISPDRDIVPDCIQEIFIDLFLRRKKLNLPIEHLKPYLFIAFRNCLLKKIEKQRKLEQFVTHEKNNNLPFLVEYSLKDNFTELEISEEVKIKLQSAVNKLSPRQKEKIYLKFEEEIDYPEISQIMKISVESARKLLYRALLSLRKTVDPAILQMLFIFFSKKSDNNVHVLAPSYSLL